MKIFPWKWWFCVAQAWASNLAVASPCERWINERRVAKMCINSFWLWKDGLDNEDSSIENEKIQNRPVPILSGDPSATWHHDSRPHIGIVDRFRDYLPWDIRGMFLDHDVVWVDLPRLQLQNVRPFFNRKSSILGDILHSFGINK